MSDLRERVASAILDARFKPDISSGLEAVSTAQADAAIAIVAEACADAVDAFHRQRGDVGRPCMADDCTCDAAIAAIRALAVKP